MSLISNDECITCGKISNKSIKIKRNIYILKSSALIQSWAVTLFEKKPRFPRNPLLKFIPFILLFCFISYIYIYLLGMFVGCFFLSIYFSSLLLSHWSAVPAYIKYTLHILQSHRKSCR